MINRRRFLQTSVAAAAAYALPQPRLYALDQAASQAAGGLAAPAGGVAAPPRFVDAIGEFLKGSA